MAFIRLWVRYAIFISEVKWRWASRQYISRDHGIDEMWRKKIKSRAISCQIARLIQRHAIWEELHHSFWQRWRVTTRNLTLVAGGMPRTPLVDVPNFTGGRKRWVYEMNSATGADLLLHRVTLIDHWLWSPQGARHYNSPCPPSQVEERTYQVALCWRWYFEEIANQPVKSFGLGKQGRLWCFGASDQAGPLTEPSTERLSHVNLLLSPYFQGANAESASWVSPWPISSIIPRIVFSGRKEDDPSVH